MVTRWFPTTIGTTPHYSPPAALRPRPTVTMTTPSPPHRPPMVSSLEPTTRDSTIYEHHGELTYPSTVDATSAEGVPVTHASREAGFSSSTSSGHAGVSHYSSHTWHGETSMPDRLIGVSKLVISVIPAIS